jgi:hypothetical protein
MARDVVELPDLVAGRHGRTSDDRRIFSTPVGLAVEDVAAAARVYPQGRELGLGTELSLWRSPIGPVRPSGLEVAVLAQKTRLRTFRLWPPQRGHRRRRGELRISIGSVVSPG